jgi:hypothetical protein
MVELGENTGIRMVETSLPCLTIWRPEDTKERREEWEEGVEAASRFELEMKVLQTSALPLGYAAPEMQESPRSTTSSQVNNWVSPK